MEKRTFKTVEDVLSKYVCGNCSPEVRYKKCQREEGERMYNVKGDTTDPLRD